ncbi:tetratricopeptide repeat protein [Pelistega sp. NLN82]|uniref:Tetratricopeptide repeat protein n=1 Tax=Pelistega ratti TaxID=2652177 RepID=A0A6L9Y4J7_9BURK|nr:tetratricopeptide repeat protein [Pelistega ratti]NEN75349.1 tetratricopeptide repeat protein [Pelistega ratti]
MDINELQEKYNNTRDFISQKEYAKAIEIINKVLDIIPNDISFLLLKAYIYLDTHHLESAEAILKAMVKRSPNNADIHYQLGRLYLVQKQLDISLLHYEKAFVLDKTIDKQLTFINVKRIASKTREECEITLNLLNQFISDHSKVWIAYFYRGLLLERLGLYDLALADFNKCLIHNPNHTDVLFSKAKLLLRKGNFREGFLLYEERKKLNHKAFKVNVTLPMWNGQDIQKDKLFVFAEQGLGDNIQFVRYAVMAKELGFNVVVGNFLPLEQLLRYNLEKLGVKVIKNNIVDSDAQYQVSMCSLPYFLNATLSNIPLKKAYLTAEPEFITKWKNKFPFTNKFKIGLVWQGSLTNGRDTERSIPLEKLNSLLHLNAEFHCLQKVISQKDLAFIRQQHNFTAWHNEITDFSDTAALIEHMDLVISVDTSVAHLSAAMGKLTWIMITHNPDFRWLLDREDSVWYENVRLFRQDKNLEWDSVIKRIYSELINILSKK